jgi:hypothetical protein
VWPPQDSLAGLAAVPSSAARPSGRLDRASMARRSAAASWRARPARLARRLGSARLGQSRESATNTQSRPIPTIEARSKATTSTAPAPTMASPSTMAVVNAQTNQAYW